MMVAFISLVAIMRMVARCHFHIANNVDVPKIKENAIGFKIYFNIFLTLFIWSIYRVRNTCFIHKDNQDAVNHTLNRNYVS
jgi:hypothetical protein